MEAESFRKISGAQQYEEAIQEITQAHLNDTRDIPEELRQMIIQENIDEACRLVDGPDLKISDETDSKLFNFDKTPDILPGGNMVNDRNDDNVNEAVAESGILAKSFSDEISKSMNEKPNVSSEQMDSLISISEVENEKHVFDSFDTDKGNITEEKAENMNDIFGILPKSKPSDVDGTFEQVTNNLINTGDEPLGKKITSDSTTVYKAPTQDIEDIFGTVNKPDEAARSDLAEENLDLLGFPVTVEIETHGENSSLVSEGARKITDIGDIEIEKDSESMIEEDVDYNDDEIKAASAKVDQSTIDLMVDVADISIEKDSESMIESDDDESDNENCSKAIEAGTMQLEGNNDNFFVEVSDDSGINKNDKDILVDITDISTEKESESMADSEHDTANVTALKDVEIDTGNVEGSGGETLIEGSVLTRENAKDLTVDVSDISIEKDSENMVESDSEIEHVEDSNGSDNKDDFNFAMDLRPIPKLKLGDFKKPFKDIVQITDNSISPDSSSSYASTSESESELITVKENVVSKESSPKHNVDDLLDISEEKFDEEKQECELLENKTRLGMEDNVNKKSEVQDLFDVNEQRFEDNIRDKNDGKIPNQDDSENESMNIGEISEQVNVNNGSSLNTENVLASGNMVQDPFSIFDDNFANIQGSGQEYKEGGTGTAAEENLESVSLVQDPFGFFNAQDIPQSASVEKGHDLSVKSSVDIMSSDNNFKFAFEEELPVNVNENDEAEASEKIEDRTVHDIVILEEIIDTAPEKKPESDEVTFNLDQLNESREAVGDNRNKNSDTKNSNIINIESNMSESVLTAETVSPVESALDDDVSGFYEVNPEKAMLDSVTDVMGGHSYETNLGENETGFYEVNPEMVASSASEGFGMLEDTKDSVQADEVAVAEKVGAGMFSPAESIEDESSSRVYQVTDGSAGQVENFKHGVKDSVEMLQNAPEINIEMATSSESSSNGSDSSPVNDTDVKTNKDCVREDILSESVGKLADEDKENIAVGNTGAPEISVEMTESTETVESRDSEVTGFYEMNASIEGTVLQNIEIGNMFSPIQSPNEEVFELDYEINPIMQVVSQDSVESENENSRNGSKKPFVRFATDDFPNSKVEKMAGTLVSEAFSEALETFSTQKRCINQQGESDTVRNETEDIENDNVIIGGFTDTNKVVEESTSVTFETSEFETGEIMDEIVNVADSLVNEAIISAIEVIMENPMEDFENEGIVDRGVFGIKDEVDSSDSDDSSTTTEGSYRINYSEDTSPILSPDKDAIAAPVELASLENHESASPTGETTAISAEITYPKEVTTSPEKDGVILSAGEANSASAEITSPDDVTSPVEDFSVDDSLSVQDSLDGTNETKIDGKIPRDGSYRSFSFPEFEECMDTDLGPVDTWKPDLVKSVQDRNEFGVDVQTAMSNEHGEKEKMPGLSRQETVVPDIIISTEDSPERDSGDEYFYAKYASSIVGVNVKVEEGSDDNKDVAENVKDDDDEIKDSSVGEEGLTDKEVEEVLHDNKFVAENVKDNDDNKDFYAEEVIPVGSIEGVKSFTEDESYKHGHDDFDANAETKAVEISDTLVPDETKTNDGTDDTDIGKDIPDLVVTLPVETEMVNTVNINTEAEVDSRKVEENIYVSEAVRTAEDWAVEKEISEKEIATNVSDRPQGENDLGVNEIGSKSRKPEVTKTPKVESPEVNNGDTGVNEHFETKNVYVSSKTDSEVADKETVGNTTEVEQVREADKVKTVKGGMLLKSRIRREIFHTSAGQMSVSVDPPSDSEQEEEQIKVSG